MYFKEFWNILELCTVIMYFKEFWNILELCTVIMSVLTCAMYAAKILFGNTAMDILRESGSGT